MSKVAVTSLKSITFLGQIEFKAELLLSKSGVFYFPKIFRLKLHLLYPQVAFLGVFLLDPIIKLIYGQLCELLLNKC